MESPDLLAVNAAATGSTARLVRPAPWVSLGVVALISFAAQLWLCQFFTFGEKVPLSFDVDPSNLWKLAYHFPPTGSFQVLNWLGEAFLPQPLTPFSVAAGVLPAWWFFTVYAPLMATLALLAMAAFLREMELSRPAALFGAVIYAWQGDILPFVYPGHYAYITSWPFFAVAAWGALRAIRTGRWAYALVSGACCGTLVGLPSNPDRGAIDSLLIAALFLTPLLSRPASIWKPIWQLILCAGTAAIIALAPLLALFQTYVVNVKLGGLSDPEETYKLVTQFSLGPAESLTYLVPGFFGWHMNSHAGPYWGWIGEWPDFPRSGTRNLNLAITTTGTLAGLLGIAGALVLLWKNGLGPNRFTARQQLYGRVLLVLGALALFLSWGWHTEFYRLVYQLPLMDKWRNPLKWLEITNFALVTLGAFGLEQLLGSLDFSSPDAKLIRSRFGAFMTIGTALAFAGLLASYPLAIVLAAKLQTESYNGEEIANIMATTHASLGVALAVLLGARIVMFALWRPDSLRRMTVVNPWLDQQWQRLLEAENLPTTMAVLFALVAALQLGWIATKFIEPMSLAQLTEVNPLLGALDNEGNQVRVSVATQDPTLQTLLQNQFAALGISSLEVSAASRIPDDLNSFFGALAKNQARLWFLAGVKNVAIPQEQLADLQQDPAVKANIDHANGYTIGYSESPDLPTHALVTLKDYLAKATFVPSSETLLDKDVLKKLADPTWDPRKTILLADYQDSSPPGPTKIVSSPDQVTVNTYTPTDINLSVHAPSDGYVLINDQYDPDWHVQVNGKDWELQRADFIFRAVQVPAGDSTITLHYVAHYYIGDFRIAAETMNNISDGAMIAAWLIAAVALNRRKKTLP